MTIELSGENITVDVFPSDGCWDACLSLNGEISIRNISASVAFRESGPIAHELISQSNLISTDRAEVSSPMGKRSGILIESSLRQGQAESVLELCISGNAVLWRVSVHNTAVKPLILDHVNLLMSGPTSSRNTGRPPATLSGNSTGLSTVPASTNFRAFINGWQSWSPAGSYHSSDHMPQTRFKPFLQPMHHPGGGSYPGDRGHFVSDVFGVVGVPGGPAVLVGFLSQNQAFGQLEITLNEDSAALHLWEDADQLLLEPGGTFSTDWACLFPLDMTLPDPLGDYLGLYAEVNHARVPDAVPVGWSSWYHYFQDISFDELIKNLNWVAEQNQKLPFELVQLDDGFQADVGDWYGFSESFPDGVSPAAAQISSKGLRPGIWLAPFIVKRSSRLFSDHPEWLILNRRQKPANAGFVWNSFTAGLDVSHPDVQDYVAELIQTAVEDWGFRYLKLDFLYAGVLKGMRHNIAVTRAQALTAVFRRIRDSAGPDIELLGCGCPLGTGVGIFDIMRIGADVAPDWSPAFFGLHFPFRKELAFPSARNAIRNILTRMPFHNRWWINDPDCILVRSCLTRLSGPEVQSLLTMVALSAGAHIVSDSLPLLGKERTAWLSRMLPPLNQPARVLDWFEEKDPSCLALDLDWPCGRRMIAARLNWEDHKRQFEIKPDDFGMIGTGPHWVFNFWSEHVERIEEGQTYTASIDSHGTGLFVFQRVTENPQWIGDTLHISQGGLITGWSENDTGLHIELHSESIRRGTAWLSIPGDISSVTLDNRDVKFSRDDAGVVRIELLINGNHTLDVNWGKPKTVENSFSAE